MGSEILLDPGFGSRIANFLQCCEQPSDSGFGLEIVDYMLG